MYLRKLTPNVALLVIALVTMSCVTTPSSYITTGFTKVWSTEAKGFGVIAPLTSDSFALFRGSKLSGTYDFYSARDGKFEQSMTKKELDALGEVSRNTPRDAGIYTGYRSIERVDELGAILWKYESIGVLAYSKQFSEAIYAAEHTKGTLPGMALVKLDAETGSVIWKKDMPIEIEPSMRSLGGRSINSDHVQIELFEDRVVIVSKGLVVVDTQTGEVIGHTEFSVQTGVVGFRLGASGAFGLGGAMLAAATKIGEVYPELEELDGMVHVFDIDGNLYAVSLLIGELLWKTKFDRISRTAKDPSSNSLLVSTGLDMINGSGKPIQDGKPGLSVVDTRSGKVTTTLDTGWIVGTTTETSGNGTWFFNEKDALLVRGMKIEKNRFCRTA